MTTGVSGLNSILILGARFFLDILYVRWRLDFDKMTENNLQFWCSECMINNVSRLAQWGSSSVQNCCIFGSWNLGWSSVVTLRGELMNSSVRSKFGHGLSIRTPLNPFNFCQNSIYKYFSSFSFFEMLHVSPISLQWEQTPHSLFQCSLLFVGSSENLSAQILISFIALAQSVPKIAFRLAFN